ncbi:MAG: HAD family hydrolase [Planctomycetota bacterium]
MSERSAASPRPAVFLDRDGTLIDELGYLADPDRVALFPGAAAAVRRLNAAGFAVVVATNQSGVARGLFTEEDVQAVHARVRTLLASQGAEVDLFLFSPFHPDFGDARYRRATDWSKPGPGMLLAARDRLGLDLRASWVVGDAERDLEAGRRAGVAGLILVRTGQGAATEVAVPPPDRPLWRVVDDLPAAVELILERQSGRA